LEDMLGTLAAAKGSMEPWKAVKGTSSMKRPGVQRVTLHHGPFELLPEKLVRILTIDESRLII
jgi:hypothetical protein